MMETVTDAEFEKRFRRAILIFVVGSLIFLASLALPSCGTSPPVPTPPPGASCASACAQLRILGCPEADEPESSRASCWSVCEHVRASGVVRLDTSCIAGAGSVEAVRECNVRCAR